MNIGMARQLRIQAAGFSYHVWARGNGRMAVYSDDRDRRYFLGLLEEAFDLHEVDCYAYCEMDTHYHAVLGTRRANLSRAIKRVNGMYAQWWNHRHKHVGHVFQGRFGAQIIQDDTYLLTVCRYVVLNPVDAGLVRHPGEWPWSSYRATAGLDPTPPFLKPETLWARLGDSAGRSCLLRYREFIDEGSADSRELPRDRILGEQEFVDRLASSRHQISAEVPIRERTPRPELASFFEGALSRAEQGRRAARACRAGFSMAEVARFLTVHYTTVSRMMKADNAQGPGRAKCGDARCDPARSGPDRAKCGDARCDPT
jgi:putative transposase